MAGFAEVKSRIWYDSCSKSSRTVLQLCQIREYHIKHSIFTLRCGCTFWLSYKTININKQFSVKQNYFIY